MTLSPQLTNGKQTPRYWYFSTARGSVPAFKSELKQRLPQLRPSYSSGGFLTYKQDGAALSSAVMRKLIFAGTWVEAMGKLDGGNPKSFWEMAVPVLQRELEPQRRFCLHVWSPDLGGRGEPALTPEVRRLFHEISAEVPAALAERLEPTPEAREGQLCLDVIVTADGTWWLGRHRADSLHRRFPGGLFPLTPAPDAASRAWLKFEEGLWWSGFPIGIGSRCADIGAAPGGGSQALLSRGAEVLGVDPAEMAPSVLRSPNFRHLRGKISALRRSEFLKTRWIIADMNVAPSYTLDALEEIVLRPKMAVRGLLFTMKLFSLAMAADIPAYIRRIKSWGFNQVRVRQLTFNHQEVMAAALKKPFRR